MKSPLLRLTLLALAALIPLASSAATQPSATWKPVAIGSIATIGDDRPPFLLQTSDRLVRINNGMVYDLNTRKKRSIRGDSLVGVGTWEWDVSASPDSSLTLINDANDPLYFKLPPAFTSESDNVIRVRFSPSDAKVSLLIKKHFFQWDKKTHRLERQAKFSTKYDQFDGDVVLSRDNTIVINADPERVRFFSSLTGKMIKTVPIAGFETSPDSRIVLSPFGNYALYEIDSGGMTGQTKAWRVVDAQTGRALWKFNLESAALGKYDTYVNRAAFARDDKTIALPLTSRKIWQIRDLATGKTIRTLPLLAGVREGAFSPDGATLYSVANGVLYRQRAR